MKPAIFCSLVTLGTYTAMALASCTSQDPPAWVRFPCRREMGNIDGALMGCSQRIKGGTFLMGAQAEDPNAPGYDPRARPDEGPPRKVKVSTFWAQAMETQMQDYSDCMEAGAIPRVHMENPGYIRTTEHMQQGSANGVTWAEAQACCEHLGGRLPTEAEWEYMARGRKGLRFPWGNNARCASIYSSLLTELTTQGMDEMSGAGEAAWDDVDCSLAQPPISKPVFENQHTSTDTVPSRALVERSQAFELYQLAGIMYEWVGDYYAEDAYEHSGNVNPRGPETGERRVQRGGGWLSGSVWEFRSAARSSLDPDMRMPDVGFRCVISEADVLREP